MNQDDDQGPHEQEGKSGAVDCGIEEGGRSNVSDLGNQGPNQTFLGDRDPAARVEGIESNCAEGAERVLNETKNAEWEKQEFKQCGFFSIYSPAGQHQNQKPVYQRGHERRDNRSSDGKDGGPTLGLGKR